MEMGKIVDGYSLVVLGNASPALSIPEDQSFDDWLAIGQNLCTATKVVNWWIGDWWIAGSHKYGARAKAAAEGIFGIEFSTLASMASVCRAFETCRRRQHLSFSHHQEVAGLPPAKADELLDRAQAERWSTRDLRAEVLLVRSAPPRWFDKSEPKQFDRKEAKEAIYNRLVEAAEVGEPCPTADELLQISGVGSVSTTVSLMHVLEEERRVTVERFQKGRVVTIVETGQRTAEPSNKAPHWRDRREEVPAPTIQPFRQNKASLAEAIEREARSIGRSLSDFLADLVYIGWNEYLAEKECEL